MKPNAAIKLLTGNANRPLAEAVAAHMNGALSPAKVRRFADNEIWVEISENMRGEDVFVIQPISRPANDNLMELLIITDALRRASAGRITAVIPYFGYARQDRKPEPRTPISAKLVANMITTAGVDRVLTVDLHAAQIQGFFDIPTDNLYAAPVFAKHCLRDFEGRDDLMVVSPDIGGVVRARAFAKRINADLAVVDKRRPKAGVSEVMSVIGDVKGRTCLLIDDLVDTAGTLCNAADALLERGATEVHAYCSHGVLSEPAVERVAKSALKSLVITDSIENAEARAAAANIRTVTLAPMLASAILSTAQHDSVSRLFHDAPIS